MTQFVIEKMTSASDPNAENIAYDSLMKYQRANDSKGDRFIHVAVQRGNVHLVNRSIIRNKDIVFLQNNDGETIMHILASYCYVQNGDRCTNLKKFANKYPDLLLIEDKKGQLPIHCAVFYSYELEFLKILWDLTVQAGGDDKIFFKDQKMAFDLIANCSMGVLEFVLEKSRHLSDKFGVRLLNRLCREEMWTDSHLGVIRLGLIIINKNISLQIF